MISDPKLPLARSSTGLPELQPPPHARTPACSGIRCRATSFGRASVVAPRGGAALCLPVRHDWRDADDPAVASGVDRQSSAFAVSDAVAIFASGFTRGVCTGLGVLNVWIGFWEAIQYRE